MRLSFFLPLTSFVLALAAPDLVIDNLTPDITCTRKTVKGDTVSVHYRGTLASDGTEFDASYNRGTPLSFKLGAGRVIQGWDQGLLDMCIGEKRKLTIPPELGYGARAMGPIPAHSTLIFETELIGIDGVARDELTIKPDDESVDADGWERMPCLEDQAR